MCLRGSVSAAHDYRFTALAGKLDIGDAVVVQVQRGAELQYISFEID